MANVTATPMMGFVEAIKTCFSKYATFSGRARRSEFWWFYLLNAIVSGCVSAVVSWHAGLMATAQAEVQAQLMEHMFDDDFDMSAFTAQIEAQYGSYDTIYFILLGIFGIISLALLIPTLAACARRLHDTGKSGHLLWLILLCGVGGIVPLVFAIMEGTPAPNQYGESPKFKAVAPAVPGV